MSYRKMEWGVQTEPSEGTGHRLQHVGRHWIEDGSRDPVLKVLEHYANSLQFVLWGKGSP